MTTEQLFRALISEMNLGEMIQARNMLHEAIDGPNNSYIAPGDRYEDKGGPFPSREQTIDNQILQYGRDKTRLIAVKYYKDETGIGLKDAKDYCEALWIKHDIK